MREKTKKMRGHKTDGRGGKKKQRGKGHKGGKGRAGAGKHKRMSFKTTWGRHGFVRHAAIQPKTSINVGDLNGFEGEINLTNMGYHKLLGSGVITKPLKIMVTEATPKAIKKISSVGGEVTTK